MMGFQVNEEEMQRRVERAIIKYKPNTGTDGVRMQRTQAEPSMCTDLLTIWCATLGRTEIFPAQWTEGVICPQSKKGDPANDRPVCLLSHTRKRIDTAVLSILNDQFNPSDSQFGFQEEVAVTQALFQAENNANTGTSHMAVFDLEKAYYKVHIQLLLDAMKTWINEETTAMVRALLGPVYIRAKNDLTDYVRN